LETFIVYANFTKNYEKMVRYTSQEYRYVNYGISGKKCPCRRVIFCRTIPRYVNYGISWKTSQVNVILGYILSLKHRILR